ncbi:helix-turn-helix domain-containing protein [Roseofilum capinflatum]|uniref:Helix-turn-helix transcriptional regulator n=1 Tax=Roseofilum capinflatum BLCC-M114 TaxID=3022440 RepID=A0ABT7B880_9CYAN|nr:helix-turn-helix transcriptional regulator [Roseofilum capinflatum]MDJ1175360.1 helix-turn-helix transcriptional regulator [Roseofilum capinflatum BLCC-M114]
MGSSLNMSRLATLVRTKRGNKGLRETARQIGKVSPSTLSRVENGKMPDMETFLLLCDWLQVPPAELIENSEEPQVSTDMDASEAIAIQLRADKNLDPATANALAALVKAAYRDLAQSNQSEQEPE